MVVCVMCALCVCVCVCVCVCHVCVVCVLCPSKPFLGKMARILPKIDIVSFCHQTSTIYQWHVIMT